MLVRLLKVRPAGYRRARPFQSPKPPQTSAGARLLRTGPRQPNTSGWHDLHGANNRTGGFPSQRRSFGIYRAFARTNFTLWWAHSPEFRRFAYIFAGVALCFVGCSMERVPFTGRWRFNCVPGFLLNRTAEARYQQVLKDLGDTVLSPSAAEVQQLRRVLEQLLSSVESIGAPAEDRLSWTLHVVETEEINAAVLPGRHIFVYTGILPLLKADDGDGRAAALLGHEVAHHILHHAAETLSSYAALLVVTWLATFAFNVSSPSTHNTLDISYVRRNSRAQESEADYLGLLLMAAAGYDPRAAVDFERSMYQADQTSVAEYLRTHPSGDNRVRQIQAWMGEALNVHERSRCKVAAGAS